MPNSIVKTITADGTTYDLQDTRISDSDISNWNSSGSGTITKVKTTAGAHTTIDVSSGAAQFNVPTNTSHLTNDSGFVTTDEKLSTTSASNGGYYPLLGTASSTASTKYYSTGLSCSISSSSAWLVLGNNSSDGLRGDLTLYGSGTKGVDIVVPSGLTQNVEVKLPSAQGTLALTKDIPTVPTNVSAFTNDAGYITGYTETDPVFVASVAHGITSSDISNWNSKTSNVGTVTSVGVSNATDGGLSVSGSPVTTSGTISVGHSNVLTSAQTTQAVYPIKIDKNGHISAYGSAVTIPSITLNGVASSWPSFYAPTTAGTSGYYLKSTGNGAPEWAAISAGGVTDVTVAGTSVVTNNVAVIAAPVQIVRW